MRVMVTGASGFIGGALVDYLVEQGYEVACLLRPTSARDHLPLHRITIKHGSLHDGASLRQAVVASDIVFHLAGATRALHRNDFFRINAEGTRNLLQACVEAAPDLKRFVLVSSLAAAGPCIDGRPVTEDDPPHPVSHYGRSKLEAERIAMTFAARFPVSIVRPPVVFGPRDRDVYQYFRQIKAGVALQPGRKSRRLSLIHVQDLVRGLVEVATAPQAAGEVYFLANPQAQTWQALGEMLATILQRRPIRIPVPESLTFFVAAVAEAVARVRRKPALLGFDKIREMRQTCWVCSTHKAETQLGFRPQFTTEEGLRQTAEWYRAHGWL